jgi:hypothetical protein
LIWRRSGWRFREVWRGGSSATVVRRLTIVKYENITYAVVRDIGEVPMGDATEDLTWRQSSLCSDAACVEVALDGDDVLVRNNLRPDNVVRFTAREWDVFLRGVRAGEFR